MECAKGGDLYDFMNLKQSLQQSDEDGLAVSEDEALYLFRQIISAVEHCHAHGIAHR